MRPHLLQLALLLPSVATAAALAGPPQSRRRQPPPKPSAADASPAAAENAVLQVELPTPLRITYATESSCVESWLCARRHEPAFGFDTETRPAFRKGEVFAPATLQLSTATDCLVVHLAHLEAPFPAALVEVLASPDALMCGLGIDDDAIELWLHHGLEVFGRVELLSMPGASTGTNPDPSPNPNPNPIPAPAPAPAPDPDPDPDPDPNQARARAAASPASPSPCWVRASVRASASL